MSLRHLPVVLNYRSPVCAGLLLAALAGCGGSSPPASNAAQSLRQLVESDGRIEWRGALACADCDGIDTQLVLRRVGSIRDYRLTETFLAADQRARFVEQGHWQRQADLLQLRGDRGSRRVFALLPGGRLQPRDDHGRPLPPRADDFLEPMTVASGQ
jgi:uncharacterized lipoprotein NlpE involved in copper resistance